MSFREQKEVTMAEKKMTPEETNEYMNKVMGFTPRMFKIINTVTPDLLFLVMEPFRKRSKN
jgi:hypothetical protein